MPVDLRSRDLLPAQTSSGAPLLAERLRRDGRTFAVWAAILVGLGALYTSLFSAVHGASKLIHSAAATLGSVGTAFGVGGLATPAGYLDATVFGLIGTGVLAAYGIVVGTRAIAGDDEDGVLALYLAQPIGRGRYVLEAATALALETFGLAGVLGLTVALAGGPGHLVVDPGGLLAATFGLGLLGFGFAALGLAAGALAGIRPAAVLVATLIALGGYLLGLLAVISSAVEPLGRLSPFWWYTEHHPVATGLGFGPLLALVGVPVLLVVLAVVLFERRDIGGWASSS